MSLLEPERKRENFAYTKTRFQFQISRRARYSPLRFILAFAYIHVYKIEDFNCHLLSFFFLSLSLSLSLFLICCFSRTLSSRSIRTIREHVFPASDRIEFTTCLLFLAIEISKFIYPSIKDRAIIYLHYNISNILIFFIIYIL